MSVDGGQRPPDPPPPPPPPPEKVEEPVGSRTWEASADLQLRENADYFDAEAQRYREIGDHGAASASQDAGDRARSLIGDSAAGDAATAGAEAMERWETSEDHILRNNADYFDAEAQRYREIGDHGAANASQDAGDRARSLIGDSAQPDNADTSPSPPDDQLDSVGTGNEDDTSGPDPAADTASDSQGSAGSTVAGSDEMSSWDASGDDQDRPDQDQREQDRQDQNQREQDRQDQNQREQDRQDQNQREQDRQDQNQREQDRQDQNQREQDRQDQNQREQDRQDQNQREQDRQDQNQREQDRQDQNQREQDRQDQNQREQDRQDQNQREQDRQDQNQREQDRRDRQL